ncbi:MAG: hypothetical protein M0Z28_19170 [Rhodospirillales bacterium]|nr:hypothetical protein [Rhodospirillales bacterium]
MTTYTYPSDGSGVARSGWTAREVAEMRLGHDGQRYEMRRDGDCWQVYGGQWRGRMSPLWSGPAPHGRLLLSFAETEAEAWAEIAPLVVFADWHRVPEAMADEDYRQMLAELAADDESEEG